MTAFPGSSKLIKGRIVLPKPETCAVLRVIALQYDADTLSRSFQIQSFTNGGDRSEALRQKGPPIEKIRLETVHRWNTIYRRQTDTSGLTNPTSRVEGKSYE